MPFFKNILLIALAILVLSACNRKIIKGPEPTVAKVGHALERGAKSLALASYGIAD